MEGGLSARQPYPLELLIDNGINRIYIQVLVEIPSDVVPEAIEAVGPFATIGVTHLAGSYRLRGTIFTEFSTVLALTNTLRAIALAFDALCNAVLTPEGEGATPAPSVAQPNQSQSSSKPMSSATPVRQLSPTSAMLAKGQNILLTSSGVTPTMLSVRAHWVAVASEGGEPELDASAIVTGADDRVLSDAHFVFFNNRSSPDGAVHLGDGPEGSATGGYVATFDIDTTRLPSEAVKVVVALAIYSADERGHSFRQVPRLGIEVLNETADGLAAFEITDGETETAMILGEIYRHRNTWKFRAIGQGYSSGLAGIATDYGVDVG